jgi:hypothetical protein
LAVLGDLPIAGGQKGSARADNPGGGLPTGSGEARTAAGEGNPRSGPDKDGQYVDAAENAMELEVTLADPRGEIDGADQQSEDSGKRMWDQESAIGDHL